MSDNVKHGRRTAVILVALAGVLAACGCVRRTVTINTKPEGALITLNDEVVGTSPVTTDFLWYGDYGVMAQKEGFEVLKANQRLNPPWFQLPLVDLMAEALLPIQFHDRQEMAFELTPSKPVGRDELIQNAKQFRDEALYGAD